MPRSKKEPVLPLRTSDRRNGAGSPQRSRRAASSSTCGGSLLSRCLCVVLVLYFQLSTFTLVQWVREHGLEAEHGLAAAAICWCSSGCVAGAGCVCGGSVCDSACAAGTAAAADACAASGGGDGERPD